MTIKRHTAAGLLACAIMGLSAAGCSQADPQGETPESASASTPSSEAIVLFKDPSETGPRLDVYDFDGHAAISVGGPIGTESVLSAAAAATDSITDLYRALHPETTDVPAELVALSERLAPALAELRAQPHSDAPPVSVDKTQAAFNSTVCKNFSEGAVKYIPLACPWSGSTTSRQIFNWPLNITAGDRTYAWNPNQANATLNWWAANAQGQFVIVGSINLPAYWWNWMSMGSGGPFFAQLNLAYGTGELGLTHHDYRFTF
jgi:hypothetical protein